VRYRTAVIWSALPIGGMFCLPATAFAVFPSMRQVPQYLFFSVSSSFAFVSAGSWRFQS
jgi:hypothetical protein